MKPQGVGVSKFLRIVGRGRAGGALARALEGSCWNVVGVVGHGDALKELSQGVDLVVIATPDSSIAEVAAAIETSDTAVVAHLSGARGLDDLAPHHRRASMHPLMALPDPERGSALLRSGAWFATAGDPLISEVVRALGGHEFTVADEDRSLYHAAAAITSNHLVAVLGQAERVGQAANVPFAALMALARATVDNVARLGPAAALTGPAARGDDVTIELHRGALASEELATYDALVAEVRHLAGGKAANELAGQLVGSEGGSVASASQPRHGSAIG